MTKTVLIVEDNDLNMKLFHDLLEAHGYNTIETKDGREALKLAREHRPDLILMDIQLPEVSGLEVTKWIKEDDSLKKIPVIAVTAFAMKGDEEKIREGGCEAYLAKPISVANFLETVEKFTELSYGEQYTCRFRGNTLVDISPRAERPHYSRMGSDDGAQFPVRKGYPLYQRDSYRQERAPVKKVRRYVSTTLI